MNDFHDDTKKSEDTVCDNALFRKAMQDVIPLSTPNRKEFNNRRVVAVPRKRKPNIEHDGDDIFSDSPSVSIESGDDWSFARPGVSKQTLRRLRRGYWPIQDNLDLHGFSRDIARQQLATFLMECIERQLRCVRIIHGKGLSSPNRESILKKQIGHWLAQHPSVMAFYQAKPSDGGSGAILLLLRINR